MSALRVKVGTTQGEISSARLAMEAERDRHDRLAMALGRLRGERDQYSKDRAHRDHILLALAKDTCQEAIIASVPPKSPLEDKDAARISQAVWDRLAAESDSLAKLQVWYGSTCGILASTVQ